RAQRARDVELGGLGGAEIPALAELGGVGAGGLEQGTQLPDPLRDFVVAEERRSPSPQPEEDEHGVAVAMVVDAAPGGLAAVVQAIGAATVGRVRQADPLGAVGGRKEELSSGGQESQDLRFRPPRTDRGAVGLLDEPTGGLCEGRRGGQGDRQAQRQAQPETQLSGGGGYGRHSRSPSYGRPRLP